MKVKTPENQRIVTCHWCQQSGPNHHNGCIHCAMPLIEQRRRQHFKILFWSIVLFCLLMMLIVPRGFIL